MLITPWARVAPPSRNNDKYWSEGTIPWVKTTEVNYGVILETEEYITPEGLRNSAAKVLPFGTLLMAMYGQGRPQEQKLQSLGSKPRATKRARQ